MCAYSTWKIRLGPEEERNISLRNAGAVPGIQESAGMASGACPAFVAVSGTLWFLTALTFGAVSESLMYGIAMTLLLGLAYTDLKIMELPPELNLLIAVTGLVHLFTDIGRWHEYLIGAVLVSGLLMLIGLLSGGRAMGGGDVKLMAALGLLIGWKKILLTLMLASLAGSVLHLTLMAILKKKRELAFGPYLAAGGMAAMLWGERIISWYLGVIMPAR